MEIAIIMPRLIVIYLFLFCLFKVVWSVPLSCTACNSVGSGDCNGACDSSGSCPGCCPIIPLTCFTTTIVITSTVSCPVTSISTFTPTTLIRTTVFLETISTSVSTLTMTKTFLVVKSTEVTIQSPNTLTSFRPIFLTTNVVIGATISRRIISSVSTISVVVSETNSSTTTTVTTLIRSTTTTITVTSTTTSSETSFATEFSTTLPIFFLSVTTCPIFFYGTTTEFISDITTGSTTITINESGVTASLLFSVTVATVTSVQLQTATFSIFTSEFVTLTEAIGTDATESLIDTTTLTFSQIN